MAVHTSWRCINLNHTLIIAYKTWYDINMREIEIIPVLHNIRSTYNVGAILRSTEGFGVREVILSGYTPRVHDTKLLPHLRAKLDHAIHKTALGAEDLLKIRDSDDILATLGDYKNAGYQIIGLENNISRPTYQLGSAELATRLNTKIVLALGEEVHGIPEELYPLIDFFVEIPMRGQKESFNVSVAAGIALFALLS